MTTATAIQQVEEAARSVPALATEHFETAQRMARALSSSTVVPKDYQNNLANVMVAMEYANRLGCSVLAVMQNLDVIHGRPSLRASFLIGTVNASKRFSPIRFRFQGTEGTDAWGCRAVATDLQTDEECVGPLVRIQTAKDEGWYSKTGSKWKTIPELMLMYRSGAWWTRVFCPELSLGLHTTDEMDDLVPPREGRMQEVSAALDAPDPVKLEATEVPSGNGARASEEQVDKLAGLLARAESAGSLTPLEAEEYRIVMGGRELEQVERAVRDVQKLLVGRGEA